MECDPKHGEHDIGMWDVAVRYHPPTTTDTQYTGGESESA